MGTLTKKPFQYPSISNLNLIHSAFDTCNQLAASFLAILAYSSLFLHSSSSFRFGIAMLMVKCPLCTANIFTVKIPSFTYATFPIYSVTIFFAGKEHIAVNLIVYPKPRLFGTLWLNTKNSNFLLLKIMSKRQ